ncbi:vitamin B6 photo-protection and homoeostasis-domain-containing protein [Phyllosticta citrichinensis]
MASCSSTKVEVIEYDDAGNVITTYVESGDNNRVDVILPEERKNIFQVILDVFLPAGYPQSVTEDYLPYQIYASTSSSSPWPSDGLCASDSLQAFSSSIAGMLSSRAVLEGVGVGDADATPTKALLLSVIQSSAGRVATIVFAARLGTALEPECKSWRLAADFFNDTGMLLDMISPGVPAGVPRTTVLSLASILRALCGVAAGSSKASLSAHFAKEGNLGELNARSVAAPLDSVLFGNGLDADLETERLFTRDGDFAHGHVVSRPSSVALHSFWIPDFASPDSHIAGWLQEHGQQQGHPSKQRPTHVTPITDSEFLYLRTCGHTMIRPSSFHGAASRKKVKLNASHRANNLANCVSTRTTASYLRSLLPSQSPSSCPSSSNQPDVAVGRLVGQLVGLCGHGDARESCNREVYRQVPT